MQEILLYELLLYCNKTITKTQQKCYLGFQFQRDGPYGVEGMGSGGWSQMVADYIST